jgi:uncharacterized membrane protein
LEAPLSWRDHPAVPTGYELTIGQRAADTVRNGMGSWPFVFGFLSIMALWAFINSEILGRSGWDPYPYILLNLFLSMLAGLQGAILLIAAKRADAIAAAQAIHHLEVSEATKRFTQETVDVIDQLHDLTREVHEIVSKEQQ